MTLPVYAETEALVVEDTAQLPEEYMGDTFAMPIDLVSLTGDEPMVLAISPVPT